MSSFIFINLYDHGLIPISVYVSEESSQGTEGPSFHPAIQDPETERVFCCVEAALSTAV